MKYTLKKLYINSLIILAIPDSEKKTIKWAITPQNYIGKAAELARKIGKVNCRHISLHFNWSCDHLSDSLSWYSLAKYHLFNDNRMNKSVHIFFTSGIEIGNKFAPICLEQ